jgi:tetratricopeptide repeat protein 8
MAGRFVRLGTASMLSDDQGWVNSRRDFKKDSKKPPIVKAMCDFLLYSQHDPVRALELAAVCTEAEKYEDWWWKARLGKCYYQLGMYREAEQQFKSANKMQDMVITTLELCKVFLRFDQPKAALDVYGKGARKHEGEVSLMLGMARVLDALNELEDGCAIYKEVLRYDPSNAEAMACLASFHFYEHHPELALRYFRRLLQMGVQSTELWNNIGLCCFYAAQYDTTLSCFEKALALGDEENLADVWYNVGQVAIGIGDTNLAFQAFQVSISYNQQHSESYNNLGILELRKGNISSANSNFETAANLGPHLFEPLYNSALLSFKMGNCQESYQSAEKALKAFPGHNDSQQLLKQLHTHLTML